MNRSIMQNSSLAALTPSKILINRRVNFFKSNITIPEECFQVTSAIVVSLLYRLFSQVNRENKT